MQVISGLIADARQVVSRARDEASNYRMTYSQPIPAKVSIIMGYAISGAESNSCLIDQLLLKQKLDQSYNKLILGKCIQSCILKNLGT